MVHFECFINAQSQQISVYLRQNKLFAVCRRKFSIFSESMAFKHCRRKYLSLVWVGNYPSVIGCLPLLVFKPKQRVFAIFRIKNSDTLKLNCLETAIFYSRTGNSLKIYYTVASSQFFALCNLCTFGRRRCTLGRSVELRLVFPDIVTPLEFPQQKDYLNQGFAISSCPWTREVQFAHFLFAK